MFVHSVNTAVKGRTHWQAFIILVKDCKTGTKNTFLWKEILTVSTDIVKKTTTNSGKYLLNSFKW